MRPRFFFLALCAGLLLPLAGCQKVGFLPYARELEDMALIRTMGVDTAPGGGVTVTISTGAGSGERSGTPVLLSGTAGTISGACLDMQGRGSSYIYYGHVGQLLLGEDLARQDARPALEYVLRDVEIRLNADLYLVRGTGAETAIRDAAGADTGEEQESGEEESEDSGGDEKNSAAKRLEAMEDDAGLLSHTMSRTVGDILERLERTGSAFVPAVIQGGQGELEAAGYGILKDGVLVGWTGEDAANGINLALGQVDADVLELDGAAVRVVGARTGVRPIFDGDKLTGLSILCKVDANLAEAPPGMNLQDSAALEHLEQELAQQELARIQAALSLSRTLDADFLELQLAAALSAPSRKAEIAAQWSLSGLAFDTTVEARILRGYDMNE